MSAKEANQDEGWEDDEEDDLFSFGADVGIAAPEAVSDVEMPATTDSEPVLPDPTARERAGSDDSFLDMLDENAPAVDYISGEEGMPTKVDDKETQDILDWLNVEQNTVTSPPASESSSTPPLGATTVDAMEEKSESPVMVEKPIMDARPVGNIPDPALAPRLAAEGTTDNVDSNEEILPSDPIATGMQITPPQLPKPVFDTLQGALESKLSTISDIRRLFLRDDLKVTSECRPHLWSRIVCGKTLEYVSKSSVADSFLQWRESDGRNNQITWIKEESTILGERIVACTNGNLDEARASLEEVLLFHYLKEADQVEVDPLLPPVACAILSAGVSPPVTAVILSNIMPAFMPILALTPAERLESAKSLHSHFYLLACYHLPLLVFHLDRYAPGWYWPKQLNEALDVKEESVTQKGRNLENQGVVPQSWLISHLAGECKGTLMNPMWLLSLWDLILTSSNNSLRFFLSLALLEKHADTLLMLTGEELLNELNRIMEFKEATTPEGFDIAGDEDTSADEASHWVAEWSQRARSLWEDTPRSVVSRLRRAEDNAVAAALTARKQETDAKAQAILDEEAQHHHEAQEKLREEKADESRERTNRARLLSYYRKYNPERESSIDVIMKQYSGRFDVLDAKLIVKYGYGFNPITKSATMQIGPIAKNTSKLLSTMNHGFNRRKKSAEEAKSNDRTVLDNIDMKNAVTVSVSSTEVIPIVCWTKESSATTKATFAGHKSEHATLKYYLVDSRSEVTVEEEGRFPTALSMSPESLMDPDRIQNLDDQFESLRGAVHIVVMGEGFSALPILYGINPNPKLQQLMSDDDSRTSLCALFFVKRGFPFVSILDGGFAAAHAWLLREGPSRHLQINSVLVDYDGEQSLFGQLEKQYQDQHTAAQVRTQRALQNMFESSMASLTLYQRRFENATRDPENSGDSLQNVQQSVKNFFSRPDSDGFHSTLESGESRFKYPFSNILSEDDKDRAGTTEARTITNSFIGMGNKLAELRKNTDTSKPVNNTQADDDVKKFGESNEVAPIASENGEQSRMTSAFVGLGKQVAKMRAEMTKPTTVGIANTSDEKVVEKSGASRFSITFGGGKRGTVSESNSKEEVVEFDLGEHEDITTGITNESTVQITPPVPEPGAAMLKNSFSRIAQAANASIKENLKSHPSESEVLPTKSRFSGLGASINKKVEQVNESLKIVNAGVDNATLSPPKLPELLKKNPFARFNKPNSGNIEDVTKTAALKQNRFVGLNVNMTQLRASAMQRVNNLRTQEERGTKAPFVEEEAISFTESGETSTPPSLDPTVSDSPPTPKEEVSVGKDESPIPEIVKI